MRTVWQATVNAGLLALLLAGCGGTAWEKPGATAAERERDLDDCQAEARVQTNREVGIDQDIASTMQRDWERSGISTNRRELMRDRSREHGEAIVRRCMAARGWVRATS
jgi:hypothetical protein